MGYHDGVPGESPQIQQEHRQCIDLDEKNSGLLLRAMKEILNYLIKGE